MLLRTTRETAGNSSSPSRPVRRAGTVSRASTRSMLSTIGKELKAHAPFTVVGALTGVAIMVTLVAVEAPRSFSTTLFWGLHPLHVLLSALVTAGMYRLHSTGRLWKTILVGYLGSIGIATLSDCIIPYLGESLLGLPNRGIHVGFIEKWWLVNPLAGIGIGIAYLWPRTAFPHAGDDASRGRGPARPSNLCGKSHSGHCRGTRRTAREHRPELPRRQVAVG